MFRSGFGHFLRTAAQLQWDEASIDLRPDGAASADLEDGERDRVRQLLAGFVVGERSVARELEPFGQVAADQDADLAAAFEVQAIDEARHARFFERALEDVAGVRPEDDELAPLVTPAVRDLFEGELPRTARALGDGATDLTAAVALYHLLLEGVFFTAGQLALLDLLVGSARLPGLAHGTELVLRDERWHVGLGASCLAERGVTADLAERLQNEGERVLGAWDGAVEPATRRHVLELHHRRLAAAGLLTSRPGSYSAA